MRSRYLCLFVILLPLLGRTQVINGYARVTAISGASLTLGTSSETGGVFLVGKQIIIMQMQDDVIGANTADNVNFGNLSAIAQAGRYEVRAITAVTRDAFGAPTGLTMSAAPGVTYNTGANGSVQIITYELLGSGGNFTTTSAIAAMPWNGSIGGVVAFQVGGTLTLAHTITADGAGFRGGARDPWNYTSPCNSTTYRASSTDASTDQFATKGEGIYKLTNTAWADGRGKILNGGGGANMINAGGGGGGNYTAGGAAVLGWSCSADAGGLGGLALSGSINANRIFMGGGGGGGEGNDNVSTDGANGGGIILIKAAQIRTTGTCSGIRISADGATAANSGNDGAGGAGGGGSIVLQCPSYSFASTCPMVIRSNGGTGGTVNSSTHGGGGGGGQGVVVFSTAQPTTNVTVQVLNGTGGCNDSGCATRANNGGGTNNTGILTSAQTILPIELVSFQAVPVGARIDLTWMTASERNNDHFTVERSADGVDWLALLTVPGALNSQTPVRYAGEDPNPLPGTSYYRLRQTDVDGASTVSDMVAVEFALLGSGMLIYPNPVRDRATVLHDDAMGTVMIALVNGLGQSIAIDPVRMQGRVELDLSAVPEGMYLVVLSNAIGAYQERLLVQR